MKKLFVAFFTFCMLCTSFGQNRKKDQEVDIINHEVKLGESVRMISKKYLVDPAEIYKLNKFAVDGISEGMVLKIPVPRKEGAAPKETPTISNDNNSDERPVSKEQPVADNTTSSSTPKKSNHKSNPPSNANSDSNTNSTSNSNATSGSNEATTSTNDQSTTPASDGEIKQIVITERKTEVNHKVVAKETLFSLAREYNVSVEDLKANNKEALKNGLKVGQTIVIPKEKTVDIKQSTSIDPSLPNSGKPKPIAESSKPKPEIVATPTTPGETIKHKVEPKETLYSLAKKYNVTVDEIKQQNETLLTKGLQIGQTLTITTHN